MKVVIVHFFLFICPHQTEVIKGPCGSVGMTFRHVSATEGDAVHVSIESVTSNSPAALADLQRGDRLISIGGLVYNKIYFKALFLCTLVLYTQLKTFFLSFDRY